MFIYIELKKLTTMGSFKGIQQTKSGFLVEGDVESMILVNNKVYVGVNNENIITSF